MYRCTHAQSIQTYILGFQNSHTTLDHFRCSQHQQSLQKTKLHIRLQVGPRRVSWTCNGLTREPADGTHTHSGQLIQDEKEDWVDSRTQQQTLLSLTNFTNEFFPLVFSEKLACVNSMAPPPALAVPAKAISEAAKSPRVIIVVILL
jgi:hypothetical protein